LHKRNVNHPNAVKHGAFAKTAVLAGEDPREFDELHSALIEEWTPIGPTEEDAVLSIAKGIWRKRRMQKFLQAKLTSHQNAPDHPIYGEVNVLSVLPSIIETIPDFFPQALLFLSADKAEHLEKKFPQQDFESNSAWARAVRKEITSVLLPAALRLAKPSDAMLLNQSSTILTPEVFKQELAVDERIDAMIDRAIKRLIQTKAMKQMLPRNSPRVDDHPKKIQGGKNNGSARGDGPGG